MEAWPAGVNTNARVDSYSESFGEAIDSFQVEVGQPLARRRTAFDDRPIKFQLMLSSTEVETLRTWWRDNLKSGVLPFTMTHPRTRVAGCKFEFAQKDGPPSISAASGDIFIVSLSVIETT